jgi:hypothetical protein
METRSRFRMAISLLIWSISLQLKRSIYCRVEERGED